jgi:hypothetical protein
MPPRVVCSFALGGPCDCPKFELRKDQDPNEPVPCRDCTHLKNWHDDSKGADRPDSDTVWSIMQKCDIELQGIQKYKDKCKTSKSNAAHKAISGLKRDIQHEKTYKKVCSSLDAS